MKQVFGLMTALLICGQAQALSCMRPDPVASYINASEASDVYYVILGQVTLDGPAPVRPDTGTFHEAPDLTASGRVTGKALGPQGFQKSVNLRVDVTSMCAGPWCGDFPGQERALIFVKQSQPRAVIQMDPCGTQYFSKPAPEMLADVEMCHRGGACEPAEF
ncbi:hypothetical protein [Actibacterium sp. 188UL27-1]|uniref:hypothetical protein n=1 Tax=Actibacterium sp. 188UL27-1 TaxID=2786961 RepID=UPI00195EB7AB|nr:hypothetical protein [Actibacterium sp. 188UL27-1]MBM7067080.1 hypothetical protein [Actibacterium sp. 188UL27-1]